MVLMPLLSRLLTLLVILSIFSSRRRHTICSRDWSSDVCSSDLTYLAGVAGRGLARPVAALRDAAIAVGRGAAPPAFAPGAPREFAPVMSAFERMAADVRRSQAALEEARRRTAQVLANVATGVIAVDEGLRVTMANARAAELLGAPLDPGDLLPAAAPPVWSPVWEAVSRFLTPGRDRSRQRE